MLIDSWYDPYSGVIILVRIQAVPFKRNKSKNATNAVYGVEKCGFFTLGKLIIQNNLHKEKLAFCSWNKACK